jgi:hypothetical protein
VYLPPIGHTLKAPSYNQGQEKSDAENESSLPLRPLAAEPVERPVTEAQESDAENTSIGDSRSEDGWEKVDKVDGGPIEGPDDELVEVDKAPSSGDVQSVHSSGINFNESSLTDDRHEKD